MKNALHILLFGILLASVTSSLSADPMTKPSIRAQPSLKSSTNEKEWSLEIGSGMLWSDVRTDLKGYTLLPVELTASTKVDEVSLDKFAGGALRGYTEFFFRGTGVGVLYGYESRFVGLNLGPRYNFVQPGWKLVPFAEGNVGFAFNDSRGLTIAGNQVGQGQDFSFQFGIALGVRYDINDDWFVRLAADYTHYSNAGLSEPARKNRAIDAAGPVISVGCRF